MSRTLAEERLQQASASVEITQDRDHEAESIKEGRKVFCAHEVERVHFRLMAHPAMRAERTERSICFRS
jgi:hypothetical protein